MLMGASRKAPRKAVEVWRVAGFAKWEVPSTLREPRAVGWVGCWVRWCTGVRGYLP